MTTSVTTASRQPMANAISTTIESVASAEMEQQLVGLVVGGLAVVARDRDVDVVRNEPALQRVEPVEQIASTTTTALAPARLASATLTAGVRVHVAGRRRDRVHTRCSSGLGPMTTSATSRT